MGKLIFIIGGEGSGHHMFREILEPISTAIGNLNQWEMADNALNLRYWENLITYENYERNAKAADATSSSKFNIGVCTCSIPYGLRGTWDSVGTNKRDCLRRPDLVGLYEAYQHTPLDIKFLVMERDPIEMTLSAVRRGFAGHNGSNALEQAKWVEDSIIYIESQLKVLPQEIYFKFRYDNFVSHPEEESGRVAKFLDLSPALLNWQSIRKPFPKEDLQKEREDVQKYFSPLRARQWPNYLTQEIY